MTLFGDAYRDRKVLVTGDSGFKGSWLTLWLELLGAKVTGVSLPPETNPNHYELLHLNTARFRGDIVNGQWLQECIHQSQPEIVFHLAAQPLVRRSYRDPVRTWNANVIGTVNLLEACRQQDSVLAIAVITTDKVYRNSEWPWGYRETDPVGGHDPYSASKACCELVVDSYRSSFFNTPPSSKLLASVRAGNVIGGGDWAEDRLVPDIARATANKRSIEIRSPHATRPWQHVLECLAAYLMIGQRLLEGDTNCAAAWNIGPDATDNRQVIDVLSAMKQHWPELNWTTTTSSGPHESNLLYLDSSMAKSKLGWFPVWDLATAIEQTAVWYKSFYDSQKVLSQQQLQDYIAAAECAGASWAT